MNSTHKRAPGESFDAFVDRCYMCALVDILAMAQVARRELFASLPVNNTRRCDAQRPNPGAG